MQEYKNVSQLGFSRPEEWTVFVAQNFSRYNIKSAELSESHLLEGQLVEIDGVSSLFWIVKADVFGDTQVEELFAIKKVVGD